MNLKDRIGRRQTATQTDRLVRDRTAQSPVVHLAEPVDRGPVLERVLDALTPVFTGSLPPDVAVAGPKGVGKSALVSALFTHLDRQVGRSGTAIGTTTRAETVGVGALRFVYVDARPATSEFQFYHAVLDALEDGNVPERGVSTDALRETVRDRLRGPNRATVVAVDHLDALPADADWTWEVFEPVRDAVSLLVVSRSVPADWAGETVAVESYHHHALADVLTARASRGLRSQALEHAQTRRVAEWADGDAHDALAALYAAAELAEDDGANRIRDRDIEAAIDAVPSGGVHLGRVLALPENRQAILAALLALDDERPTIKDAASAIADREPALSSGTITRFLYELADDGVLERVRTTADGGSGRQPSYVVPRFPTIAFRRLRRRATEQ